MPVLFTCPHCTAQTLVDDCYIGATGPCATCGKSITVTTPDQPAPQRKRKAAEPGVTNRAVRVVLAGLIILSTLGGLFLWAFLTLIWPEMERARHVSARQKTRDHLALIGTALRAYHEEYGSFPPAVIRDSNGQPMHSWRVLILPFMGEEDLYNAYSFDEPWNGPNNSLILQSIPRPYQDPSDREGRESGETMFLAITGDGTVFPRTETTTTAEILDGESDTVMVAESARSSVPWTEPVDLQVTRMSFTPNDGFQGRSIATNQGGGPLVLSVDGKVKELRTDATPAQLRGMVTIRGGETVHWHAITKE